jgi:hypothetical protein
VRVNFWESSTAHYLFVEEGEQAGVAFEKAADFSSMPVWTE